MMFTKINQCPYKGGKAVYRARVLLSLIGNSYIYDDFSVCASEGIYRNQKPQEKNNTQIHLIPNPADVAVTVSLSGFKDGICRLQIINMVNQSVASYSFDCTDNSYKIDTSELSPGIYTVHIFVGSTNLSLEKLVIVR